MSISKCCASFSGAQLIDAVQTDVKHAALLPSSLTLTIYRQGSLKD
ncbi:hypothetical protein V1498_13345 [Peribacillus sp. SCS-26]